MARLFFALQPDATERPAIAAAARPLLQEVGGEAVPAANLHLTLCFLGEVDEGRLPALVQLAGDIAPRRVALSLTQADCWQHSRTLCLLPGGGADLDAVADLAALLRARVLAAGFPADARPLRAHVTVGRRVAAVAGRAMHWPQPLPAPVPFTAGGHLLLASLPGPAGPRYAAP